MCYYRIFNEYLNNIRICMSMSLLQSQIEGGFVNVLYTSYYFIVEMVSTLTLLILR